jgi:acyl-CoA synthetase (AMP-forming)/AMP-acid ligase II
MNILDVINKGASYWSDKVAVISDTGRFTFQQVNERSNRLANGLLDLGCQPQDHLGVILENCHEYIEICFAKYKINAVWITLSARLSDEALIWQINDADIDTLFIGIQQCEQVARIRAKLSTVKRCIVIGGQVPSGFTDYEQLISSVMRRILR